MTKTPDTSRALGATDRWPFRLAVLTLAHVVGTLGMMSVLALAPLVQADLGFTATEFGLLIATYAGSQVLVSPMAGQVADQAGVGRTLALSMIVIAAGVLAVSQAWSLPGALAGVAALGIGYAFINPTTARGVMDWAPPARRATGMGIKQTGVPIGGALAAGTALLGALMGWRTALLCLAGLSLAAIVPCLTIARARQTKTGAAATLLQVWPTLIANRNLGAISLATAGFNICQASYFGFLTLFMKDAIGVSSVVAGLCLGMAQTTAAMGRVAWGMVADRSFAGRRKWLYVYLGASASLLFAVLACAQQGWTTLAIGTAVLLGLTIGSYAAIVQTMVVEAVPPDQAGAASGYYLFLISFGNMLGPLLFGMMVDMTGGYYTGWIFLGLVGALATGVLLVGFSDQRQWSARQEPGVAAEGQGQSPPPMQTGA